MIGGAYPGSIKAPDLATQSKLMSKRDRLFALYQNHFRQFLSLDAVLSRADTDQRLASEIYINHGGQLVVHSALIMNSSYFKKSLRNFIDKAKQANLITDVLGQGLNGLTVLMVENGSEVVIKLPVSPTTNFEKEGYIALANEYDHGQKVALLDNVDHRVHVQPVDGLSLRGKILAFGKFGGRDLLNSDDYTNSRSAAFDRFRDQRNLLPERIAELINFYMEAYKKGIPTLSYGSPHNTRLIEDGRALALFDLGSQPPTPQHDQAQIYLQKKLFGSKALACALFQVLMNGNVDFCTEGEIGDRFRRQIDREPQAGRDYYSYREGLLRNALQVLLDRQRIARDELISNLEALRDVNKNMDDEALEYLQFKSQGKLTQKGQDLIQRIIDHFKAGS